MEVFAESVSVSSHSSSDESSSECLPISALLSVLHVAVSVSIVRPIGFRFGFLRSPSGTSASSVRVNTRRVSSSIRQVSSPNGIERSRQSCPTEGSIGSITCSVSTASFFRTFLAGLD